MPDYTPDRIAEWLLFIVALAVFWPAAVAVLIVIIMAENARK